MSALSYDPDLAYASSGGDLSLVPTGPYCYRIVGILRPDDGGLPAIRTERCPYWGYRQIDGATYGYCAHLNVGDWEEGGTLLLFDQVKECGINDIEDSAPSETV